MKQRSMKKKKEKEKEKTVRGQAIHGENAVHPVAGPVGGIVVLWAGKATTGR
jgi:hypothetical protein